MVRGFFLLLILALAAPLLAPWPAAAETISFEQSSALLAKSCAADITANCRGVNLDSRTMKECLSRNQDAISPQCKADYLGVFDAIQKRIAARVAVANACAREIVKVCHGSTKETSKSIPCLLTQRISARCSQSIHEAGYQ